MSRVPQVLVTLSPSGDLQAELPGANGSRRIVPLRASQIAETLQTILRGQLAERNAIGEDGAPTAHQVRHWERHGVFADPQCPFCLAEGRTVSPKTAKRKARVLSEYGGVTVRVVASKHKSRSTSRKLEDLGL
jgi:hypothetical protein